MKNSLIIISYFDARPKTQLNSLVSQLKKFNTPILISINGHKTKRATFFKDNKISILKRPNTGMNIGAWNDGFLSLPNYDYYHFLQDECVIQNDNFLEVYNSLLNQEHVGMVGESLNPKWNLDWEKLLTSTLNYIDSDHLINGAKVSRVNFYLLMLEKWNINPGQNAAHLRSLVWAFKRDTIQKISGFPCGLSKGECIASEIAVSKKIEQIGLQIKQADQSPFKYIYHTEWDRNGYSKI
jgi:hypothetical protein